MVAINFVVFFFQAEDGIRAGRVTGVQTCALPIFCPKVVGNRRARACASRLNSPTVARGRRSEERRVGKECRSRWSPYDSKKKKVEQYIVDFSVRYDCLSHVLVWTL